MLRQLATAGMAISIAVEIWAASVRGAELRATVCDRPVCRTVAIVPESPSDRPSGAKPVPMDAEMMMGDWGGGCESGACGLDCQGDCGFGCQTCCLPRLEMWGGFDFLLGWRHSIRTPPLATTSPNGTAQANAGVLPNATIIFPNEPFGEEARPGGRVSVGAWLDPSHCWGIEGRYFALADQNASFSLTSTGNPILARPLFDNLAVAQGARLLAFPGFVTPGRIDITTESQLLGGDALLRRTMCDWGVGNLQLLIGYQFARLDENLLISDLSTDADPANLIQDGTTLAIRDQFSTRNQYHAASIGAVMNVQRGDFRWEILGKIGLGNMRETVTISGQTTTTVPGQAAVVDAFGLLAQGTNLGTFTQDKFSASPEVNVRCIYQVNRCVDVSLGYTFLYFTSVAQPGEQIEPSLPVPAVNAFEIRSTEYWMHGFQCGFSVVF